MKTPLFTTYEL